ncbi:hypothetical protein [Agromyces subbeticus]|uniref:hypothetical protein n=1 Tax=Agromyces subbeticus TaxID=293890 RepID=UPI0012EC4D0E|nr:hypothetical protein [Agromyces subbeticus]
MPARPTDRAEALASGRISLALEPVEPDRARWSILLGIAGAASSATEGDFFLAELRPRRGNDTVRRIWLQPEDDVPPVRDRIERARNGAGLIPSQMRVADSVITAMSEALGDDLVLCSPREAHEFGLHWRALGDLHLRRGYALAARDAHLGEQFVAAVGPFLAELLGMGAPEVDRHAVDDGTLVGDHAG